MNACHPIWRCFQCGLFAAVAYCPDHGATYMALPPWPPEPQQAVEYEVEVDRALADLTGELLHG